MRKNILLFIFMLLLLTGCAPRRAQAQFLGYTSPQTVTTTLPATGCTSSAVLIVPNLGQSFHFVSYQIVGTPVEVNIAIQGSYDGTNWLIISDISRDPGSAQLEGYGYFPVVRVVGTCFGGSTPTIAIQYSGTSVASSLTYGDLEKTTFRKPAIQAAPVGSNYSASGIRTPYGNSSGILACQYAAPASAGGTVTVQNGTDNVISVYTFAGPFTLDNTVTNVPQLSLCPPFRPPRCS